MRISRLQQAVCADRSQIALGPDPSEWIKRALPAGWHLHTFHFFVNWQRTPLRISDRAWLTRAVDFDSNEDAGAADLSQLEKQIRGSEVWQEYEVLGRVLRRYGLRPQIILLPEVPVAVLNDRTPFWVGTVDREGYFHLLEKSLAELKDVIRHESGGPVYVGSKGLTHGTSAVECYLSHSDSAYPGDVDCVIVDENDQVRCVIEYKKHTLRDLIGAHLINRYYPTPDGRKYQRLDALVRHLQDQSPSLTFVVLYYSTMRPEGRLQEIGELKRTEAMVVRDSGELSFYDSDPSKVGLTIMRWLEVAK